MQARSQEYAAKVYPLVKGLTEQAIKKRYGSLCHKFPLIVRENGLAAAFGFLAAKGGTDSNSPENLLLAHYAEMLGFTNPDGTANPDALHSTVVRAELTAYRHFTQQTLHLAEWFKRYAEGVLKVDASGESIAEEDEHA
jgi:CRISPR-associated protein Cmr5